MTKKKQDKGFQKFANNPPVVTINGKTVSMDELDLICTVIYDDCVSAPAGTRGGAEIQVRYVLKA